MGDDLLFCRQRHAVTGRETEKSAFICREPCTCMAFDNPGDFLAYPAGTQEIGSTLCVQDRMGCPPPDVVEHRTFTYQINPDESIERCISERSIPHRPAMSNYLIYASCFTEQVLAGLIRWARHDPVIF